MKGISRTETRETVEAVCSLQAIVRHIRPRISNHAMKKHPSRSAERKERYWVIMKKTLKEAVIKYNLKIFSGVLHDSIGFFVGGSVHHFLKVRYSRMI